MIKFSYLHLLCLLISTNITSQDSINPNVFSRGLFMPKEKFEVKLFNNIYTETGPY